MEDRDPVTRAAEAEAAHATHLERSARKWDRWSDWYTLSEQDFAPIRAALIERADLSEGDHVLDVGCGPGVNFEELHAHIGPKGAIVAVDYSEDMVAKAQARIAEHGWTHIDVNRADATTADLGGPYDVATATLALSVMPDIQTAVENVHDALRSGGRLAVLDVRPFPSGYVRVLNPLVRRFLRWYANWNPAGDVLDALDAVFEDVEILETHFAGATYTALARKA